jgi:hypothetical protein
MRRKTVVAVQFDNAESVSTQDALRVDCRKVLDHASLSVLSQQTD